MAAVVGLMLIVGSAFGSGSVDEELLDLGGIHNVTIKAQFLDVDLVGSDSSRVDLSVGSDYSTFFSSQGSRVRHERDGDTMNVWVETDWPFGPSGGGRLRFQIPRQLQVRVETVSGRITARGLAGGTCDLRTVSGAIQLHEVSGGIKARTISGSIIGDDVDFVSDSTFSTVSGRVDIQVLSPLESLRFDLSSISGRISVGAIGAARGLRMGFRGPMVRAQTVSGGVRFR